MQDCYVPTMPPTGPPTGPSASHATYICVDRFQSFNVYDEIIDSTFKYSTHVPILCRRGRILKHPTCSHTRDVGY